MTPSTDFDRLAQGWLAEGPTELSDRVLEIALGEVHVTRQRRPVAPLTRTTRPIRLLLVAAVLIVLGAIAGALLLGRSPVVNPGPTGSHVPTTVPSPSAASSPSPAPSPTLAALPVELQGLWRATHQVRWLTVRTTTMFVGVPSCGDCWVFNASVEGDQVHFFGMTGAPANSICYPTGQTAAHYRWSITNGTLTFQSVVDDPCSWRSDWLDGELFTRVPTPSTSP